jgi:hypothetical protein
MNDVLDALQLVNEYENTTMNGASAAREFHLHWFENVAK